MKKYEYPKMKLTVFSRASIMTLSSEAKGIEKINSDVSIYQAKYTTLK